MENEKFQHAVLDKLETLTNEVCGLKSDVSGMKDQVSGIDLRLGKMEVSVSHIQEQTAGLLEFRSETKGILENLAKTKVAISAILGDHEVQIRKNR
ncbi:MAG TPA: hypothetical protein VFF14_09030 [Candidatus Deferrimicrobium sp.]|nr:hypothetical protein [Candidatus Deferrimicrobium sp.]